MAEIVGILRHLRMVFWGPQVLEFVAFKERLERSHQLMVVRIEFVMLALKRKAANFEEIQVYLLNFLFLMFILFSV